LNLLLFWICCPAALPCRNWVLATNTLQAAQHSAARSLASPVVAIVGKGHIPGMVYVIEKVVDVYTDALASHMMEQAEAGAAAEAGFAAAAGTTS
jgi:pheromone shutdown protein TraB